MIEVIFLTMLIIQRSINLYVTTSMPEIPNVNFACLETIFQCVSNSCSKMKFEVRQGRRIT